MLRWVIINYHKSRLKSNARLFGVPEQTLILTWSENGRLSRGAGETMYFKVENRECENAMNTEPVCEICLSIERDYRKVSFGIGCEHRKIRVICCMN